MPPNFAMPRFISSSSPRRAPARFSNSCRVRVPRPGAWSSIRPKPLPRPMRPAAARSACARAGRPRTPATAPIAVVVTEIPLAGAKDAAHRAHRRTDQRKEARSLPTCATNGPKTCASCSSRARAAVDPALLMESLFKLTELESRVPLNMNVLVRGRIPQVVGLAEALSEWLAHRREVGRRRSRHRLRHSSTGSKSWAAFSSPQSRSCHRAGGRAEAGFDEELQAVRRPGGRHPQYAAAQSAPAAAGTRQDEDLRAEKKSIEELLRSAKQQWKKIAEQIKEVRGAFGPSPLGKRRTALHERRTRRRLWRPWSSASRSPSWSPRRA